MQRVRTLLACGTILTGCSDDGGGGTGDTGGSTSSTTAPPGSTSTGTSPSTETTPTTGAPDDTGTGASPSSSSADTTQGTGSTGGGTTAGVDDTTSGSSGPGSGTTSGTTSAGDTTTSAGDTSSGGGTETTGGPMSKCVATPPTMPAGDCAAVGVIIQPPYDDDYTCYDLGPIPGVPQQWGGIIIDRDDPNVLLVGGAANTVAGKLYAVGVARDPDCHILGYTADPTVPYGPAEFNDGGLTYHPDAGPLFISRWPSNELGQLIPGDQVTNKIINLGPFGVVSSPGGVTFVPPGFAGEGLLKAVSWPGGQWYTFALMPDGMGTFNMTGATMETTIVGGPEAFVYVSDQNPEFAMDGFLVAEWSAGNIAAYTADDNGDPIPATRKDFILGLDGAESAYIDPLSGDFLFATFAGEERLIAIRGFVPQPQ